MEEDETYRKWKDGVATSSNLLTGVLAQAGSSGFHPALFLAQLLLLLRTSQEPAPDGSVDLGSWLFRNLSIKKTEDYRH